MLSQSTRTVHRPAWLGGVLFQENKRDKAINTSAATECVHATIIGARGA